MVLHECPFCHRPFEGEVLSKEQVDSNEATKVGEFPMDPSIGRRRVGLRSGIMYPEAYITYKVTYRCKHCGKEWSKYQVEDVPLPREYVEDEDEP